jgi:hypothetical protein
MIKKVIIIGNHPIADNLIKKYENKGFVVERQQKLFVEGVAINDYDELCLLAGNGEDDKAIVMLAELAEVYNVEARGDKRLVCHLLLQKNETLRMLQTCDLCDVVRQKIDVYPFTMDEMWSRSIVLDYEPITAQSEKHIHLVIFGLNEIAQMVAIQAALVAHYPNYVRNHLLRTRITMIDEQARHKSEGFVKRYQHLFDNSFYRIILPSEEKAVDLFHKPMYEGKREDFVDVEWEFVEAETWNVDFREKLRLWAKDDRQLMTLVMADQNHDKNAAHALCLPDELYARHIPIYIYGQQEAKYDVTLPLVRMAKNVNYIYGRCYSENIEDWQGTLRYSVEIDEEERERSWAKLSSVKRMSSIYNAMTIPTKMRSMGLNEEEWDKFYDIPQQDIDLLAQVEHNRWSVEELILGFRPCTDDELAKIEADVATQKDAYKARKIHFDLRAYNDLRPDGTGKPVQVYDLCLSACLPLIAKAFADEKGGEA